MKAFRTIEIGITIVALFWCIYTACVWLVQTLSVIEQYLFLVQIGKWFSFLSVSCYIKCLTRSWKMKYCRINLVQHISLYTQNEPIMHQSYEYFSFFLQIGCTWQQLALLTIWLKAHPNQTFSITLTNHITLWLLMYYVSRIL